MHGKSGRGFQQMNNTLIITKYQKLFGVGQIAGLIGLIVLSLLYLLDRVLNHPAISSQPVSLRIIGAILIAIWVCWHIWCMKAIVQWWRHDKLCTTGPFKYVKHPIYAGGLWFGFLGISLLFNSWIILFQPVILFFIISPLVRREEKMMTSIFGDEYQQYAAQTGRLFPRLF
jgi:protein-S-isoprenylcysteine O-methyltransferase Ste14